MPAGADVGANALAEAAMVMLTRRQTVSIPVAHAPPEQLSLSGRGAISSREIAAGSFRPAEYSSHQCVGDISDAKPRALRACLFRRVCLRADGSFTYHRHPNASLLPFVFDRRYGHQEGVRNGSEAFVGLNKHVRYKPHTRWSPVVLPEPLPQEREELPQLHLLSAPFVPTNLGHVIWEEAFPLLLAMAQLGVYTETPRIMRTAGCNESYRRHSREPPSPSTVRLCRKFEAGFLWPLLGRSAAQVERSMGAAGGDVGAAAGAGAATTTLPTLPTLRELSMRVSRRRGNRPVCFARVLAGGYHDMFNVESHAGKEPLLALYRHRVLTYHGVDPSQVPQQHAALLLRKQGRRAIANVDAVGHFLERGCDGQCEELAGRTVTMSPQTLTIREQLALISHSTLAISPPGGVSMALPFLPDGACVILINYQARVSSAGADDGLPSNTARQSHRECRSCSWTMEAELWRHMRHVRRLYYQVWDASDFAGRRPGRDSSVIIKMPRLAFLIRAALNAMAAPT